MTDEMIPAGAPMVWDEQQGRTVPMPKQESSPPRKACANLDCEFNKVILEPGLFKFSIRTGHYIEHRTVNCIAFWLGSKMIWLCEDCAKKDTAEIRIRLR